MPHSEVSAKQGENAVFLANIRDRLNSLVFGMTLVLCASTGSGQEAPARLDGAEQALRQAIQNRSSVELQSAIVKIRTSHSLSLHPLELLTLVDVGLGMSRQTSDRHSEAMCLDTAGIIAADVGRIKEASESLPAALELALALGDHASVQMSRIDLSAVYNATGNPEQALQLLTSALEALVEPADAGLRASALTRRAEVYNGTGRPKLALSDLTTALKLETVPEMQIQRSETLIRQGDVYSSLGDPSTALISLREALISAKASGDRRNEGRAINFLGEAYFGGGDTAKALASWKEALPIEREVMDRTDEATTLHDIGAYYYQTGDPQQAVDYYQQSVVIQRDLLDAGDEAVTLNDLGNAYAALGNPQKAFANFQGAIVIERSVHNIANQAITLHSTAFLYQNIGQPQEALTLYNEALVLERQIENKRSEAVTLSNLGSVYQAIGQTRKALRLFSEALPVERALHDPLNEAITLHDIGTTYLQRHEFAQARLNLNRALQIERKTHDRDSEAYTLWRIASLSGGSPDGYLEALQLAQSSDDPELSGRIETSLMRYDRAKHRPSVAIFFGKRAVNNFQQIRGKMADLSKLQQDSFIQSHGDTYRELAKLLFDQGRFPEAEQVIVLLKSQEYAEFSRGDRSVGDAGSLPATPSEAAAATATEDELTWLRLKGLGSSRTTDQQVQYLALKTRLEQVNKNFFDGIQSVLASNAGSKHVLTETNGLQNVLRQLTQSSPHTIGVYTVLLENELDLIVVTPNLKLVPHKITISRSDLTDKVRELRKELQDPCSDPRTAAEVMYKLLVAPILTDLSGAQAKTIVWELDGALRYIPMSSLYDGAHYLAESYSSVIFGVNNQSALIAGGIAGGWSALGFGSSAQQGEMGALPAVSGELRSIITDPADPKSSGPIPGKIYLDKEFTRSAVARELDTGYPIVHIASHFVLKPGSDQSYLLLGADDPGLAGSGHLTYAELGSASV